MIFKEIQGVFSREFEIFMALAQNHSFRQTAEKFGLSISSISRLMHELENRLHITLFDRSCKPIALTVEGRWLFRELQPSLRHISQSIQDAHQAALFKPYLRIGFIDSFSYDVAPEFIENILPRIRGISCLTGGADRLVERLNAQEVDVILTINPCFDIPNLRRHLLLREPSVTIFPKEERFRQAGQWSWHELSLCGLPFISSYNISGGGKLETVHFTTHDLDIVSVIHSDNIGMREKLVSRGNGWAIMRPLSLLQHRELIDKLYIFVSPPPVIMRDVYILARSTIQPGLFADIVNTLADILKDRILCLLGNALPARLMEGIEIFGMPGKSGKN